jgi:hypothetical protein
MADVAIQTAALRRFETSLKRLKCANSGRSLTWVTALESSPKGLIRRREKVAVIVVLGVLSGIDV